MNQGVKKLILGINNHGLLKWMPDKANIQLVYHAQMNKKLNLNDPKTFNEKLQWLKLYDRKPEYGMLADKYAVRAYIEKTIGRDVLVPLYGVWENARDIDFDSLPDRFVLKCTHDSGSIRICRDKRAFNMDEARAFLNKRLKRNCFYFGREWPYKNLKPRIIAEQYLIDEKTEDLRDYKVHCFHGEPKVILVCSERHKEGLKEDWFTVGWKHLPIHRPTHANNEKKILPPQNLEAMLRMARTLSAGIPFVRIDFYEVNGKVYFSEITMFPTSGYTAFVPEKYDSILGDWIELPE